MFLTSLRRELLGRKKQTLIVSLGLALAIALVVLVGGVSAGIANAQSKVLTGLYGVGTDVTVTAEPQAPGTAPGTGQQFSFAGGAPGTGGDTNVSTSRLVAARGAGTLDQTLVKTAGTVTGVKDASGALALNNITFGGTFSGATPGTENRRGEVEGGRTGGGNFNVDTISVLGLDPAATIGPIAGDKTTSGRALATSDATANVAVLDSTYATTASLAVGGTVSLGGTAFSIVGIVDDSGDPGAANVYIPLGVAQQLSGETGKVSTIYVQATSADTIPATSAALTKALAGTKVSTQADLAAGISGSLGSAASLVSSLGTWLSIIVLAAAVLLAILFTVSGVTRRTREFGTLKAIGWSNRRVVGQVAGESVVQALFGAIVGVVLGLVGTMIVNAIAPTVGASTRAAGRGFGGGGEGGGGFGGGAGAGTGAGTGTGEGARAAAEHTTNIALHLPFDLSLILIAVGLAVLAGLLAGAIGGWRAARLSPAAALRAIV
ncbi:ABC-type antimicrobial peptide transport system permease subunit [Mycetocola sp. BIGb0189]|uniref:ABC transporter permease n=1 Tax=Mycetocola sp. BIGb0189 TaxID=2940604 RepID=UPI002166F6C1|nr:ABC transporter permease [Mycetocola sp. BIGb0189]MCS4277279.1 ABC-type antimicrobial peptide transport system permease subunit [Mycetocola sp. BIGb0189]